MDDSTQSGYPPATAAEVGASCYPSSSQRDQDMGHQAITSPAQAAHDIQDAIDTAQDARASTPQSEQHRHLPPPPAVSAEDLQLAAQLTQGLAPIMAAHNEPTQQLATHHSGISDQPSRLTEQIRSHLDQQTHHHALEEIIAQHDAAQHHPFVHNTQPHSHLPHISIDNAQSYQMSDETPPRKRSKVSRACDECRRKKIRCDATTERGEEPCGNCKKSSVRCLFSRVPQKRGPSKGYIKELADRLNSIEGKLGGDAADLLRRVTSDASMATSTANDGVGRKRHLSSVSHDDAQQAPTVRPTNWAAESCSPNELYSEDSLAPQPAGLRVDCLPPRSTQLADEYMGSAHDAGRSREVNEIAFQSYLNHIHPTLPFLPATKARTQDLLEQCPLALQDAFNEALLAAIQSIQPASQTGDCNSGSWLLNAWNSDGALHSAVSDFVHLQTLILLAIEVASRGPEAPSKSSYLGRAWSLAESMNLALSQTRRMTPDSLDEDSQEKLSLRAWWSLVMLDRWVAIGTATSTAIKNESVVMNTNLRDCLGEGYFGMIQLSNLLGHLVPFTLAPPHELGSGSVRVLSASVANVALETFRVHFPSTITPITHPVIHLVYWHCRLLIYMLSPKSLLRDVMWACRESAHLLVKTFQLPSPFRHHCAALTTLCLLELANIPKTREEASMQLRNLVEGGLGQSSWELAIREKVVQKLGSASAPQADVSGTNQGLHHLANIATATKPPVPFEKVEIREDDEFDGSSAVVQSTPYTEIGFDPLTILHAGYLNLYKCITALTPSTAVRVPLPDSQGSLTPQPHGASTTRSTSQPLGP